MSGKEATTNQANEGLVAALQQMKAELLSAFDSKMDKLQTSLSAIDIKLSTLAVQVEEMEPRISANQDNIIDLVARVEKLEEENAYLKEKADADENRSRSWNLRVLHVPEHAEGRDILGFMNKLIPHLLGEENFTTPPVIEKIHRTPMFRRHDSKAGPRPILVRFQNYQDKQRVMRLAREKKELTFTGIRIHIYPDYSAALVQKRRLYDPIKKKCQEMDIKYSLLFPCRFRIMHDGKQAFFSSPDEAKAFLRDVPMNSP